VKQQRQVHVGVTEGRAEKRQKTVLVPVTKEVERQYRVAIPSFREEQRKTTVLIPEVRAEERQREVSVVHKIPVIRDVCAAIFRCVPETIIEKYLVGVPFL